MSDINFVEGKNRFNFRIAAYVTCKDKILLSKHDDAPFYNMVGGRIQMGESTEDALRREFKEELGIEDFEGRLFYIAENFFDWMGHYVQELLFIYKVELDETYYDYLDHFKIKDSKWEYTYWFTKDELKDKICRPELIHKIDELEDKLQHAINK